MSTKRVNFESTIGQKHRRDDDDEDGEEEPPEKRVDIGDERDSHSNRLDIDTVEGQEDADEEFTEDGARLEPFNLRREMEDGHFDAEGNYVQHRGEKDKFDDADAWLDEYKEKFESGHVKPFALSESQRQRDKDAETAADDDNATLSPQDVLKLEREMMGFLRRGETVSQAMRRLRPTPSQKKGGSAPPTHATAASETDSQKLNRMIDLADMLLRGGKTNVYDCTSDDFSYDIEKDRAMNTMWEYRWTPTGEVQGPCRASDMQAWANTVPKSV